MLDGEEPAHDGVDEGEAQRDGERAERSCDEVGGDLPGRLAAGEQGAAVLFDPERPFAARHVRGQALGGGRRGTRAVEPPGLRQEAAVADAILDAEDVREQLGRRRGDGECVPTEVAEADAFGDDRLGADGVADGVARLDPVAGRDVAAHRSARLTE